MTDLFGFCISVVIVLGIPTIQLLCALPISPILISCMLLKASDARNECISSNGNNNPRKSQNKRDLSNLRKESQRYTYQPWLRGRIGTTTSVIIIDSPSQMPFLQGPGGPLKKFCWHHDLRYDALPALD